jgi:hypothetical protein
LAVKFILWQGNFAATGFYCHVWSGYFTAMGKKPYESPFANLGPPGIARRIVAAGAKGPPVTRSRPAAKIIEGLKEAVAVAEGQETAARIHCKRGRPKSSDEPWKDLGISERTYYRRQKDKGLG